ncbi:small multi-drug export protein [bacterium]|nr:small multi-drug export protein [bacterium]
MQGFIDWAGQIHPVWGIIILTFFPLLELRAAIPYGLLATELPWWVTALLAVGTNWLVAPLVYLFLKYILRFLTRWPWFAGVWGRYCQRVQRRIEKAVNTWGAWGLAIFIGIPLPGSGVYTGALGAYLLGMGFRRFMWVALVGVLIAGALVTAIVLSGNEALSWLVNDNAATSEAAAGI